MTKILKVIKIIVALVQWIIVNGIPFIRSLVEYIKKLKEENELKKVREGSVK